MKKEGCVRCGRVVNTAENINETGEPCTVFYTMARTSGIRPKVSASARRRILCESCTGSIGLGPNPHNGAFNEDVYEACVELLSKNRDLISIALEQKLNPTTRLKLMPGSKPDETLGAKQLSEPLAG